MSDAVGRSEKNVCKVISDQVTRRFDLVASRQYSPYLILVDLITTVT